jgi:hypothetical protein
MTAQALRIARSRSALYQLARSRTANRTELVFGDLLLENGVIFGVWRTHALI